VLTTLLLVLALTLVLWPGLIFKIERLAERRGPGFVLQISRQLNRYLADHDRRFPRKLP
jgi:hypothetical protein